MKRSTSAGRAGGSFRVLGFEFCVAPTAFVVVCALTAGDFGHVELTSDW